MRRDRRPCISKGTGQRSFVEDWVGVSPFLQEPVMFDSDNNNTFPNSQDWGQHSPWNSSTPNHQIEHKRLPLHPEATGPQRHGAHYWQFMNQCAQPEGMAPKPGIETWHYPSNVVPTTMAASSSSGIYSSRNSDAFRPHHFSVHSTPFPRPPHHLFATGTPISLSEAGPPSLPPPLIFPHFSLPSQAYPQDRSGRAQSRYPWETVTPYCASQTLRQRMGVDPPTRFSTGGNTAYPPPSYVHYDSISTAPTLSTLPYYSASLFGTPSSNYRSQTALPTFGISNADPANYAADHGCYSLPVTVAACEHQSQANQTNRPSNNAVTVASKQSAALAPNASGVAHKRGCHRRTLSDPGLSSVLPSEPNVPSNPPPLPPLRLDGWLKGRAMRGLSERKLDETTVPSVIPDSSQWFQSSEERKGQRMTQVKTDGEIARDNMSRHSSVASDLCYPAVQPLKSSSNAQPTKSNSCYCNGWSSPMKLMEEVAALKESNRKLSRELRETKKELEDLKVMLPMAESLKHNGPHSWQYNGMDYQPGMIAEIVQELREAAQLREEAFLSHIHSSIVSQGATCQCGSALFQDGELSKRKMASWWWGRGRVGQNKSQQQSPSTCSPVNSSMPNINAKAKPHPGMAELESLKERLLQEQEEREQTNLRLMKMEEKLNNYKIFCDNHIPRSNSLQESDLQLSSSKGDKVALNDSKSQRHGLGAKMKEDLNREVALLKDDVQKLRLQLQDMTALRDPIGQEENIEQLKTLLQKIVCPSNGISVSGNGSTILSTIGCFPSALEVSPGGHQSEAPITNKTTSGNISFNETHLGTSPGKIISRSEDHLAKVDGDSKLMAYASNSVNSVCSSSSSSCSNESNMGMNSGHPPVTMHGPVTDL